MFGINFKVIFRIARIRKEKNENAPLILVKASSIGRHFRPLPALHVSPSYSVPGMLDHFRAFVSVRHITSRKWSSIPWGHYIRQCRKWSKVTAQVTGPLQGTPARDPGYKAMTSLPARQLSGNSRQLSEYFPTGDWGEVRPRTCRAAGCNKAHARRNMKDDTQVSFNKIFFNNTLTKKKIYRHNRVRGLVR